MTTASLLAQRSGVVRSPVADAVHSANWEFGGLAEGGVGLQDRSNFSFLSFSAQLGRVLTNELGTGLLKGDFEYAVQVTPFWQSYTPTFSRISCPANTTSVTQCSAPYTVGGTYTGFSATPIILRWNFTHGERIMPWVQAAGGVIYTTKQYPAVGSLNYQDPTQTGPYSDTSKINFSPQGGIGMHYFLHPRRSVDFALIGEHISSASLGDKNPGVNSSLMFTVGYTWWK